MLTYVLQTDGLDRFFPSKFLVLVSLPIRNHNINSYPFTPPLQNYILVLY